MLMERDNERRHSGTGRRGLIYFTDQHQELTQSGTGGAGGGGDRVGVTTQYPLNGTCRDGARGRCYHIAVAINATRHLGDTAR